ncbi:nitrite reductase [Pseudofrankia asymbiotica]|uniref:Nitrite reductase n=1 Tax=Pseudofrankia asymbiotica TaxID=1834516 RepID=A0A1V2IDB2_9ACTN|nr:nitrite reductase [Pseudofrankia asymbiotica]ONH31173.1 nitrite reductase [Pseudofrankia asymbiotica]
MSPGRPRADRCPGALVLHEAADGGLARIRLPGGLVGGGVLAALAALAESFGEHGAVELTSRGNLQLRGVPTSRRAELADQVAELGLLPSATHERVRNIVASPFAGLTGAGVGAGAGSSAGTPPAGGDGVPTAGARLEDLVRGLDEALCADPELAELSGRFLFGLDDGTGDIAALAPDAWAAPAPEGHWWVGPAGVAVDDSGVVGELLAVARAFLRAAGTRDAAGTRGDGSFWRVRDLPDGGAELAAGLRAGRPAAPRPAPRPAAHPVGVWRRPDGGHAAAVHVPLGRLTRPAADLLATVVTATRPGTGQAQASPRGEPPLRITPWRSVVVPCLKDPPSFAARARRTGLVTDPASIWTRVTACAGRPGCASALADVRADAARAVAAGLVAPVALIDGAPADGAPVGGAPADGASVGGVPADGAPADGASVGGVPAGGIRARDMPPAPTGARAHWSGCGRRCGRPPGPHVEIVAGPAGYLVRAAGAEPKES